MFWWKVISLSWCMNVRRKKINCVSMASVVYVWANCYWKVIISYWINDNNVLNCLKMEFKQAFIFLYGLCTLTKSRNFWKIDFIKKLWMSIRILIVSLYVRWHWVFFKTNWNHWKAMHTLPSSNKISKKYQFIELF